MLLLILAASERSGVSINILHILGFVIFVPHHFKIVLVSKGLDQRIFPAATRPLHHQNFDPFVLFANVDKFLFFLFVDDMCVQIIRTVFYDPEVATPWLDGRAAPCRRHQRVAAIGKSFKIPFLGKAGAKRGSNGLGTDLLLGLGLLHRFFLDWQLISHILVFIRTVDNRQIVDLF